MEGRSLYSPINPHFFQPLLPGFHTHLNIPVAFFSKHVQGRKDQNKVAKLISDASDKTWLVKVDGLKLTDGWEEFAVAHDLRVGDITVFRHEGEMVFHVTSLGPSCCEILYTSSPSEESDDQTNIASGLSSTVMKKSRRNKLNFSSNHSRFVTKVSVSSLRNDQLYLPLNFARRNGLNKMSGQKIVLVNEEGGSWNFTLKYNKADMHTYVKPGWRRFCAANGMSHGHYTFKLVRKSGPPVIRLCRAEHRPQAESTSSTHYSFYVGSVTLSSLKRDKLYLGRNFVNANGLDKGCREIDLKNEWGRRWTLTLNHYESINYTTIGPGWKTFCQVNGIKAGDSFKFKLVGTGEKPILSLYPTDSNRDKTPLESPEDSDDVISLSSNTSSRDDSSESQGSEWESLGDESISQECLEMEKEKCSARCRASSSYSQNRFVTLTLTPYAVTKYKLFLPMGFSRVNGINKPGKITLLGQDGVKWVVDLLQHKRSGCKRSGVMRLGKGWRDFCGAQGLKLGDSFVLELFWEDEASPVLKFCAKLNSV
ncbi:hypothetical protein AALP_AA1G277000 [Arabis alpina]|uniref:TF-B3 domain-containing protein n=1 Tax=Arabis alpina TaxID=50452 RepID=A0A087HR27_ARAAL|nr:hypothetical protein AALP_AA1G277000 [Arabis alpina]